MTIQIFTGLPLKFLLCLVLGGIVAGSEDRLVFRPQMHQPRIYQGAPAGVHVTTVHAYDPERPRNPVIYNLTSVLDYEYFVLDQNTGNITTAKAINRVVGESYQIMVAAVSFGLSELEHLQVAVTELNQFSPRFEKSVYRAEIHSEAPVDTPVLQVRAHDPDPAPHNAEVYYRMDQNMSSHYFTLEPFTGKLLLARELNTTETTLLFGIFAEDGGSPKRWAHVQVEIIIRSISAPEDVRVSNVTVSSAAICWTLPLYGDVSGYLLSYNEVDSEEVFSTNITSDELDTCVELDGLKDGTEYEFQVCGWNPEDIGQMSQPTTFTTVVNYCLQSMCKVGECFSLSEDPWYRCDCPFGYYGHNCEMFDNCSTSPCSNKGKCLNTTSNEYVCICAEDYTGPNCGSYNPCLRRLPVCENGGTCQMTTNHTYVCMCPDGFYGWKCRNRNLCVSSPCLNGGTCTNTSDNSFTCTCRPGITGELCETDVDECASHPCREGATCLNNQGNFSCICAPGYIGPTCSIPEQCPQDRTDTEKGMFYWNATNHSVNVMVRCPFGSLDSTKSAFASRKCRLLSNGTVAWGPVDVAPCKGKGFVVAEELAGELRTLTEDPARLNSEKLEAAAQGIETIAAFATQDRKLAQGMVTVISNVLNANSSVIEQDESGDISANLLQIVDDFTSKVQLGRGENMSLETDNIRIHTIQWHPEISAKEKPGSSINYEAPSPPEIVPHEEPRTKKEEKKKEADAGSEEGINTTEEKTTGKERVVDPKEGKQKQMMQVFVPHEALEEAHRRLEHDVRVKFIVYYNDKLFRERTSSTPKIKSKTIAKETPSKNIVHKRKPKIRQPVVQISVGNITLSNLSNPLVYIFPLATRHKVQCVFWKEKERVWSTEGLTTNQTETFIICESNHLTAFSVLLDPTPYLLIPEEHKEVLSMISYIGCVLSILGLLLTIITYSLFRCLNRDHQGKILLNLCVSLLLMNLTFLLGSLHSPNGRNICAVVALLIHYFLLTSLTWMCVEAWNMYQLLVHVFASAETHFLLKRCFIAWGIPLLIVAVTVGNGFREYYKENSFCMLSPQNPWAYYLGYLGPSCLILFINLIVFILVSRVLFTPRMTCKTIGGCVPSTPAVTAAQVRGAFTVMVLLGVTWVFGTFAIGEAKLVFQYLFCITNSLQGFLIFLVRCLHYPEARSAWVQLIKYGKLKKYRGVLPPGAVSWSTSSHTGGKLNGPTTSSRLRSDSSDGTGTFIISSSYWNRSGGRDSSYHPNHTDVQRVTSRNGVKHNSSIYNEKLAKKRVSTSPLNNLSRNGHQKIKETYSPKSDGFFNVSIDKRESSCDNTTVNTRKETEEVHHCVNKDTDFDKLNLISGSGGEIQNNTETEKSPISEGFKRDNRSASLDDAFCRNGDDSKRSRKGFNLFQRRRWHNEIRERRSASMDAGDSKKTKYGSVTGKGNDLPRLTLAVGKDLVSNKQHETLESASTDIEESLSEVSDTSTDEEKAPSSEEVSNEAEQNSAPWKHKTNCYTENLPEHSSTGLPIRKASSIVKEDVCG